MKIQNEEAVSPGKTVTTEDAVSPVIGVILMVAITVILAAVIAAFVFGLAGTTGASKNVALTMSLNATSGNGVITWQGGADLDQISSWEAKLEDGTQVASDTTHPNVGDVDETTTSVEGQRVLVTATFTDGATQVIFDKRF